MAIRAPKIDLTVRVYLEQRPEEGELVAIVGENSVIGKWDPKLAVKLNQMHNNPNWCEGVLNGTALIGSRYKYIRLRHNQTTWEPGEDRKFVWSAPTSSQFGAARAVAINDKWGEINQSCFAIHTMSFNIRYNNPRDGANAWPHRKERVAQEIRRTMPDVIGFQEVLHDQLQYLEKQLPEYSWVGSGRDDGFAGGEYSPVFYNGSLLKLETAGTFWLSETPWTPGSRSWGAALPRICTWAILQHVATARRFAVFNTHLDHISINARANGLQVIFQQLFQLVASIPAVVMGDFNADEKQEPIVRNYFADSANEAKAFPRTLRYAKDVAELVAITPGAQEVSFPDWDRKTKSTIDYILVKPELRVLTYNVVQDDGIQPPLSDHRPIQSIVVV